MEKLPLSVVPSIGKFAYYLRIYFFKSWGMKNVKTFEQVFYDWFKMEYDSTDTTHYAHKVCFSKAVKYCRDKYKPFIVSIRKDKKIYYGVPTTEDHMENYKNCLKNNIKGCEASLEKRIPHWLSIEKEVYEEEKKFVKGKKIDAMDIYEKI